MTLYSSCVVFTSFSINKRQYKRRKLMFPTIYELCDEQRTNSMGLFGMQSSKVSDGDKFSNQQGQVVNRQLPYKIAVQCVGHKNQMTLHALHKIAHLKVASESFKARMKCLYCDKNFLLRISIFPFRSSSGIKSCFTCRLAQSFFMLWCH